MTKKTTKTVKRTRKVTKPEFLINTIGCETVNDIYSNYIEEKVRNNVAITLDELDLVKNNAKCTSEVVIFMTCDCKKAEKKPWYKRLWNWICGK